VPVLGQSTEPLVQSGGLFLQGCVETEGEELIELLDAFDVMVSYDKADAQTKSTRFQMIGKKGGENMKVAETIQTVPVLKINKAG
jgi:hypothetical protein